MQHLRESYNGAQNRITALQNDVADLVHILQTNDIPVPEHILEHIEEEKSYRKSPDQSRSGLHLLM